MKNLGKVSIGIALYLVSKNVISLLFGFLYLILGLIRIHIPLPYGLLYNIFGGFLPNWLSSFGAIIFLIVGFIILIIHNEKITEKKYYNPLIITGVLIGIIISIIPENSLRQLFWRGYILASIGNIFIPIVKIIPYALIIFGYCQLLGINIGNKEQTNKENNNVSQIQTSTGEKLETKFTGGVLPIFLFTLWFGPFMLITLGFAFPWIICIIIKWVCENTIINGKRFTFKGTGGGLFGRYILWSILTFLTLGIFGYWAIRNYIRWAAENIEMTN